MGRSAEVETSVGLPLEEWFAGELTAPLAPVRDDPRPRGLLGRVNGVAVLLVGVDVLALVVMASHAGVGRGWAFLLACAAATALGLTAASGANLVAASGAAGNTVSVNLAGGDATSGKLWRATRRRPQLRPSASSPPQSLAPARVFPLVRERRYREPSSGSSLLRASTTPSFLEGPDDLSGVHKVCGRVS